MSRTLSSLYSHTILCDGFNQNYHNVYGERTIFFLAVWSILGLHLIPFYSMFMSIVFFIRVKQLPQLKRISLLVDICMRFLCMQFFSEFFIYSIYAYLLLFCCCFFFLLIAAQLILDEVFSSFFPFKWMAILLNVTNNKGRPSHIDGHVNG